MGERRVLTEAERRVEADVESLSEGQRAALRKFGHMPIGASFTYDEPARLLVTKRQKRAALDALATIARLEHRLAALPLQGEATGPTDEEIKAEAIRRFCIDPATESLDALIRRASFEQGAKWAAARGPEAVDGH